MFVLIVSPPLEGNLCHTGDIFIHIFLYFSIYFHIDCMSVLYISICFYIFSFYSELLPQLIDQSRQRGLGGCGRRFVTLSRNSIRKHFRTLKIMENSCINVAKPRRTGTDMVETFSRDPPFLTHHMQVNSRNKLAPRIGRSTQLRPRGRPGQPRHTQE